MVWARKIALGYEKIRIRFGQNYNRYCLIYSSGEVLRAPNPRLPTDNRRMGRHQPDVARTLRGGVAMRRR